jgi:hypothetical protein
VGEHLFEYLLTFSQTNQTFAAGRRVWRGLFRNGHGVYPEGKTPDLMGIITWGKAGRAGMMQHHRANASKILDQLS